MSKAFKAGLDEHDGLPCFVKQNGDRLSIYKLEPVAEPTAKRISVSAFIAVAFLMFGSWAIGLAMGTWIRSMK